MPLSQIRIGSKIRPPLPSEEGDPRNFSDPPGYCKQRADVGFLGDEAEILWAGPRCWRSEVQFKWQRLRKFVFEDVKSSMQAAGLSRDRSESLFKIRHGVLCRRFNLPLY